MTAPARFKQAELDRIFKAAKRAGVGARLKPDGTIEVLTESASGPQGRNPWDEVLHGAQG